MNYIGSKIKLLPFIEESILSVVDNNCKVFCDLFAGTGTVGSRFKEKGFKVISNDIQYYAYVLNKQLIDNHKELNFFSLGDEIKELNDCKLENKKSIVCKYLTNLKGKKSFIYHNYSPSEKSERMYFTNENAMKGDASRSKIEDWYQSQKITKNEYYFLIASLIKSMDKYANVLSVYGAYLKYFKKRAQKQLVIEPHKLIINKQSHEVYNQDANKLIHEIKSDILYLDPPYNSRQYASNYHVLETIAKYDKPKLYGKTGLREYKHQRSLYCLKEHATKSLEHLVQHANTKYIFLSYSNEGIIPIKEIKRILEGKGEYGYFETKYSRYKSDSKRVYKANFTIEYLHYCKCD
ncbi:MAG: modification methylase [Arcobacter sp.]|nr:MAG: modification methylase [Arcobacter sp.]